MPTLTDLEAYAAMYEFLRGIYERTGSSDLGALLGGMSLLKDGETADPAAWADWETVVGKVKGGKVDLGLGLRRPELKTDGG